MPVSLIHKAWDRFFQECRQEIPNLVFGPDEVLSGRQAFIAAFLAGARIEDSKLENGKLTLITEPVGVVRTNGQLTVYSKALPR